MQDVGRTHWTKSLTSTTDRLTKEAVARHRLRRFPRGTLLIPKSGASVNLNHRALLGTDAYVVSHLAAVVPKAATIDAEYLYYWSLTYDPRHQAQTTSLPSLPTALIKAARLPVPSIQKQRRIVDLLGRAEGIVRLRREAHQMAAELIPAIFIDMFGDPATNSKGWRMSAIERLCGVQTGATPRKEERCYYDGGTVPWARTGEVRGGHIWQVEERITELAVEATNCKVFPANTILVAMYGQGQTRGRAGMLRVPAATNQACAAILPGDAINAAYLFAALNLQYERLRAMGRGGNQANLNLGMIKSFEVPCPPKEAQLQFVERAAAMESILRQQGDALEKATAMFDALLSRAFH